MLHTTVYYFAEVLTYLLIIRAIMSWVVKDYSNKFVQMIIQMTNPILEPMKILFDKMGWNTGMVDFSFLATYFAIRIISTILIRVLYSIGL